MFTGSLVALISYLGFVILKSMSYTTPLLSWLILAVRYAIETHNNISLLILMSLCLGVVLWPIVGVSLCLLSWKRMRLSGGALKQKRRDANWVIGLGLLSILILLGLFWGSRAIMVYKSIHLMLLVPPAVVLVGGLIARYTDGGR
ncbi:hypothetical protein KSX_41280 [Ktedonospora formicarum]|uniref:Uncharacterized protein n=1 Tax=Ktedonospora formicarum TaxID=2778364 RepID=A0A8J3MV06_9CHLR|nr:hypothetical protein KSX_41280 [Ktedonospora formicarum]